MERIMAGSPLYKGDMTFTPETGDTIFRSQIVRCVVTYTSSEQDEDIPDVIQVVVNFLGGVRPDTDTLPLQSSKWTLSLSVVGDSTPKVYQGEFYAFAPGATPPGVDKFGYDIELSGYTGLTESQWKLAAKPATTICSLDRVIVPTNLSDSLNVEDSPDRVVMRVAVTDESGNPAPNYAVYWSDDGDATVFTDVRAFADTEKLSPAKIYSSELAPRSPVIRGLTDDQGAARLTLVPKKNSCRVAVSCWTQSKSATNMDPVAVYAPEKIDYNFPAPSVDLPTEDGRYNLDSAGSNVVPVTISTSAFEREQQYDIFIFMNDRNVQYKQVLFPSGGSLPPEIPVFLAKPLFHSDSDSETGKEPGNKLFYVVSSNQGGCKTSVSTGEFHCIGDPGKFEPDPTIEPRDLPPPVVEDAAGVVNVNTIQNGLRLNILVKADKGWTPKAGDLLASTIYLDGWDLWTNQPKGAAIPRQKQLTQADITAGNTEIVYPDADLRGYAPDQESSDQARFYAEYYVVQNGYADEPENRIYSQSVMLNLDTGG